MDNFFIAEYFDWQQARPSRKVEVVNSILERLGLWTRLTPPDRTGSMTNVEQRMNMYHLVSQVLAYGVPGDLVELGCNQGQSSVLIQKIVETYDPGRTFHVYDSFEGLPELHDKDGETPFARGGMAAAQQTLLENFEQYGLKPPLIHPGWFQDTLPSQLPERICFAYLDGDLYESILVSLEHVYPRLSRGAVCLIDDYCDPQINPEGWNDLPGVKQACDEYLADKPEEMTFLYSGSYSHGFFRKL